MTIKQILKKLKVNFSVQLLVTSLILTVTIFLLFVANFKTYSASTTVLVKAKSQIAAEQQSQIVGNIVELPTTLAFYDHLLSVNKDVEDKTVGNTQDKRKQIWNEKLSVKKIGSGSMIKISLTSTDENDADKLAAITTRTLLDTVSSYYDIKNDLDLRIIDGPVTSASVPGWPWFLISSILLGFALGILLQSMLVAFENKIKVKPISPTSSVDETQKQQDLEPEKKAEKQQDFEADFETDTLEKPNEPEYFEEQSNVSEQEKLQQSQERAFLDKIVDENTYPNYPEMPVHGTHVKASAPDNLPIGDDFAFQEPYVTHQEKDEMIMEEREKMNAPEEMEEKREQEPSAEEFKKRLNQLLRGE